MRNTMKAAIAMRPEVLRTMARDPQGRELLERGLREYLFCRDECSGKERIYLDAQYAKVQAALEQVPPPSYVEVKA